MESFGNLSNDRDIHDLLLELDFENIPTTDYCEIVVIFKYCPSLVNEDIVFVSEEIITRIESTHFLINKDTYNMINNLHSMLHNIPDTSHLIDKFTLNCPWLSKSPSISPVASPKIMKKIKQPFQKKTKVMKKAQKTSDTSL